MSKLLYAQEILADASQRLTPDLFDALGVPEKNLEMYHAVKGFIFPKKPGKRLRPAEVLQTVRAYGLVDVINAYWAASSIEIDHNKLLMWDDIQDESRTRRGEICLYLIHGVDKVINFAAWLGEKAKRAIELEFEDGYVDLRDYYRLAKEQREQSQITAEGQDYEFCVRRKPLADATEEETEIIQRKKTARYTVVTPFVYGAIISGITNKEIEKLKPSLEELGVAFQITDDALDCLGYLNKDWAGDLEEGKRTRHLVRTYQQANARERQLIDRWVGQKGPDGRFLLEDKLEVKKEIIAIMDKYGEIASCRKIARQKTKGALQVLRENLPETEETQGLLNLYRFAAASRRK